MRSGTPDVARDLVLGGSVLAMLVWCVQHPAQGLPVLGALVSVPVLAVLVKAGVEVALILLDDRWARGRER